MNDTKQKLESVLLDAYRMQLQRYTEAQQLCDELSRSFSTTDDTARRLERLHALMDNVAEIDQQTRTARQAWQQLDEPASPPLRALAQQLERTIKQLLESIHGTEQLARTARERLLPQLNNEARTQQMQAAYGSMDEHEVP